jgi:hypothetical protein
MTTKLKTLRSKLAALRRARRSVRLGSVWSVVSIAVLWLMTLAFLADWTFEMSVAQRVVLLFVCAAALLWALRRFAAPFVGKGESVLDVALLVEKEQGIDSDLVAALEFESADAASWGSGELREAVVARAEKLERSVDFFAGFSSAALKNRLAVLLVTVLSLASFSFFYPDHAWRFFQRIALGSQHYPTRTRIVEVKLGDTVLTASGLAVDRLTGEELTPTIAFGKTLVFEIRCEGELPDGGVVEVESFQNDLASRVELEATEDETGGGVVFRGEIERLTESIVYQIRIGDARTDPARVDVIPSPLVQLELVAHAPKYVVEHGRAPRIESGARQIAVVEGTTVDVRLRASNTALVSATITIDEKPYPLQRMDSEGKAWSLTATDSPLTPVTAPVRYSIQVVDRNTLPLEQAIEGSIRILTDRKPAVRAVVVSQKVLPTAKPRIEYAARDDYGLDRIELRIVVERPGHETRDPIRRVIRKFATPQSTVASMHVLDLAALGLRKGDQVELTVEAFDYRGDLDGKAARSDALLLQVTDERGVISSMQESDERSARQLDAIIEKQLGIGGSR